MGIINATQDSFSGDGVAGDLDKAVALAKKFEANGVDVIDVGGASSRPGADPTPIKEELARVVPVIEAIHAEVELPISIDTTWATVAEAALGAGATILNDISGLQADPELASLVAEREIGAVLMHNQRGREHTDVIDDIRKSFIPMISLCETNGIPASKLILDPGFGFGWSIQQNLELLRRLPELADLQLSLIHISEPTRPY